MSWGIFVSTTRSFSMGRGEGLDVTAVGGVKEREANGFFGAGEEVGMTALPVDPVSSLRFPPVS